jgi:hypothetical protein
MAMSRVASDIRLKFDAMCGFPWTCPVDLPGECTPY